MGSEKKFSLDDKYQLDEIKKQLENASDMLDIVIKVSEKDKNGLKLELGLLGIWSAMTIDWVVRSICYVGRILSGKWLAHKNAIVE